MLTDAHGYVGHGDVNKANSSGSDGINENSSANNGYYEDIRVN
jgi:hypothetical protein